MLTPYDANAFRLDELTILRGIGAIDKTQALCSVAADGTLNCPDAQQMFDDMDAFKLPLDVEPCSVIKYGLFARNGGGALLKQGRLRDTIPNDTTLITALPLFANYGALYRVNGGEWTTDVPRDLPTGSTVEVAADLDGDRAFTTADGIPAQSNKIGAALYVQVKGPNCTAPTGVPFEVINNFEVQ